MDNDRLIALSAGTIKVLLNVLVPGVAGAATSLTDLATEILRDVPASKREMKQVERVIEDIADDISARFQLADANFLDPKLDYGERRAATDAVISCISAADLSYAHLAENAFNGELVASLLERALHQEASQRLLSERATRYAEVLQRATTAQICAVARTSPNVANKLALKAFLAIKETPERILDSLNRVFVPSVREGTPLEIEQFKINYLEALANKWGELMQFGLQDDVPTALQWQPVDSTYISLVSTDVLSPADLKQLAQAGISTVSDLSHSAKGQPIEDVIGRLHGASSSRQGIRLLISGLAGSGKTTLTRWLSVKVAVSEHDTTALPGPLHMLTGRIPFLVNLRTSFGRPDRAIKVTDVLTQDVWTSVEAPGNWTQTVLMDGRGVILIDGLDELTAERRIDALQWLLGLLSTYPGVSVIVTSRPEAIDPRKFADLQFSAVQLQNLAAGQVENITNKWFRALQSWALPRQASIYESRRLQLLCDLSSIPSLRQLSNTPLLTAMLCAYYANGSSAAPMGRAELLGRVIAVLVHTRDRARELIPAELQRISLDQKLYYLSEVAFRMFTAGASTIEINDAHRAWRKLAGSGSEPGETLVPSVNAPSLKLDRRDQLGAYLLDRSVVFGRLNESEAQFAHRLFLEYLAAFRVVNFGQHDELLRMRNLPGWYNVITFCCAIGPAYSTSRIIDGLFELTKQDPAPPDRRRLIYCLAEAIGVGVLRRERDLSLLEALIKTALPPRTSEESALLATIGPPVIQILPFPTNDNEALAYITTLRNIGGETAMHLLGRYARASFSLEVDAELIDAWEDFAATTYVEQVLRHIDLRSHQIRLTREDAIEPLGMLDGVVSMTVGPFEGLSDLHFCRSLPDLRELDLTTATRLPTLSGIEEHPALKRIALPSRPTEVLSVIPLASCPYLAELYVESARIRDLSALRGAKKLRSISLIGVDADVLEDLTVGFEQVTMLNIDGSSADSLGFVSDMPNLVSLRASTARPVHDMSSISELQKLRRLSVRVKAGTLLVLPRSGSLESVVVHGQLTEADLYVRDDDGMAGIRRQRALKRAIFHDGVRYLKDLSAFNSNRDLRELRLGRCATLSSLYGVQVLNKLKHLEVWDAAFSTLSDDPSARAESDRRKSPAFKHTSGDVDLPGDWSISSCQELETLTLQHCQYLVSLEPLIPLPNLRSVTARLESGSLARAFSASRPDVELAVSVVMGGWWWLRS